MMPPDLRPGGPHTFIGRLTSLGMSLTLHNLYDSNVEYKSATVLPQEGRSLFAELFSHYAQTCNKQQLFFFMQIRKKSSAIFPAFIVKFNERKRLTMRVKIFPVTRSKNTISYSTQISISNRNK